MPERPERDWLRPQQLADREGVSRRTVWAWVEKGIVEDRRLAPKTGVRVRLRPEKREKERAD